MSSTGFNIKPSHVRSSVMLTVMCSILFICIYDNDVISTLHVVTPGSKVIRNSSSEGISTEAVMAVVFFMMDSETPRKITLRQVTRPWDPRYEREISRTYETGVLPLDLDVLSHPGHCCIVLLTVLVLARRFIQVSRVTYMPL
jgi:hypothetical protein